MYLKSKLSLIDEKSKICKFTMVMPLCGDKGLCTYTYVLTYCLKVIKKNVLRFNASASLKTTLASDVHLAEGQFYMRSRL
jgi:hypothetical protein